MKEIEIGSKGPLIQFMHANANPPGCYLTLANDLQKKGYKIVLPEQRPLWPESNADHFNDWNILADDLIKHMDQVDRKNVIGLGHSMGAIAMYLAAIKRPDLFSKLVMIDPVILPEKITRINKYVPFWIKKKLIPIIKIASNRRDRWPDKEAVTTHLRSKKVFQRWANDVWDDFLEYGIKNIGSELTLVYPKEWERRVYGSAPHLWPLLHKSPCPITIIRAEFSDVLTPSTWERVKKCMPHAQLKVMKGVGHLMPFEKPNELGAIIKDVLKESQN